MGYSTFLFADPSTASGAGRILDLFGTMDDYNDARTPAEADIVALALDMAAVGSDLASVISKELPEGARKRIAAV